MTTRTAPDPTAAVSLRTWFAEAEAATAFARVILHTPFVPESLRRYLPAPPGAPRGEHGPLDEDGTVAVVSAALLTGQELGFPPMSSLRVIDVIRGVPALRAIALRGLVQKHGHDITVMFSNGTRAVVRGRRANGETQESTWTLDRAKQQGLFPGREDSQWRRQPQNMLVARATAEVARWVAADAIAGVPYVAEELLDGPDGQAIGWADGIVVDEAPPPAEAAPRTTRRKTAVKAKALPPAPADAAPAREPAAPPVQPAPDPPSEQDSRPIRPPQRAYIWATFRDQLGITEHAEIRQMISQWIKREITSGGDLTQGEAAKVIAEMNALIESIAAFDLTEPPEGEVSPGDDA